MLAEAKREAERLVADARDKAAQEASEQEVVKRAEREAADILEEARQREREVRLGAEDYADEVLGTLEVNLGKFLQAVQRGRERLQGRDEDAVDGGGGGEPFGAESPRRTDGRGGRHARPPLPAPRAGGGGPRRLRVPPDRPAPRRPGPPASSPRSRRSTSTVTRSLSGLHLRLAAPSTWWGPAGAAWRTPASTSRSGRTSSPPTAATPDAPFDEDLDSAYVARAHLDLAALDARRRGRGGARHAPLPRGLRRASARRAAPISTRAPAAARRGARSALGRPEGPRGAAGGRPGRQRLADPSARSRRPLPFREPSDPGRTGGRPEAKDLEATARHAAGDACHRGDPPGALPPLLQPGAPAPRLRRVRSLPRPRRRRDRGVAPAAEGPWPRGRWSRSTGWAATTRPPRRSAAPSRPRPRGSRSCWWGTSRSSAASSRARARRSRPGIELVHAPDVISSAEEGARAVRAKPESSVAMACRLVGEGRAGAAVSAGNTGAMLAAATLYMRRVPGVIRPAIAVVLPSDRRRRRWCCSTPARAPRRGRALPPARPDGAPLRPRRPRHRPSRGSASCRSARRRARAASSCRRPTPCCATRPGSWATSRGATSPAGRSTSSSPTASPATSC